jgi:predicted MFS family arabinose efflux permease
MVGAVVGGLGWGLANGALLNYLIDRAPADDRPAHMAWYNIALNLGILIGSSGGAVLETAIGPRYALLVGGILRALAGLVFLIWG